MTDLRRRLRSGPPVLLDGATGTELNRRGVDTRLPLWSARALLEAPGVLRQIHLEYLQAGAEVITANTFRTHRRNLARAGLGDRAAELTRQAVDIARAALREAMQGTHDRQAFVAGSIAPLEDCYSPELVPPDAALEREHAEMARNLAAAQVDFLLVETMNTVREALAATRAAVATGLPTFVSVVCNREGNLLSGETLAQAAPALAALLPDAMLVNCAPAPDLHIPLASLRAATSLPVGGYGNVGHADDTHGWVNTDAVHPQAYARYARRWLDLGATIIGGCCGTTPEHIRALRALLASWRVHPA